MSWGRIVAWPVVFVIRFYQRWISPLRPPTCRFYPSCSAYAVTSLERFGVVRGTWLAVRRLFRCHPWNAGGVDHVPLIVKAGPQRPTEPALEVERAENQTLTGPSSGELAA